MQSELKSLSKIFSEVIFRIPDYQRGYSWSKKHLKDFWNDIEQLPTGKCHYTGVLTLEPVQKKNYDRWEDDIWIIESKRYAPMYIVDGQQRLTTAVILIQIIIDSIEDSEVLNYNEKTDIIKKYIYETKDKGISKSYIFGYEKDNPSYEYLKQNIFCNQSINHSVQEETIYTKNLNYAKKYFSEKIQSLEKKEIEKVFAKLTQQFLFNIFYIEKDLDVFVTFETMNNRGKPLSHLELLKNRLIYLSTKVNCDKTESEHLRKAINESWKSVYHYLGKIDDGTSNDDSFLGTHYTFYFAPKIDNKDKDYIYKFRRENIFQDQFKDKLLEEIFTARNLESSNTPLTVQDIFSYSQSLKELVKIYFETKSPEHSSFSEVEKTVLAQIKRLGNSGNMSLATMANVKKAKDRENLLEAIERYNFCQRLTPHNNYQTDTLEETVDLISKRKTAEQVTKTLTDISDKYSNSAELIESIMSIGNKTKYAYYGWGVIRFFMYEYEQDLKKKSKTTRELLIWSQNPNLEDYDSDHKTIEHIYPQRAHDKYWQDKFKSYNLRQRNALRNSLGNLLPVSHGKNSSLSNKGFDTKKGSATNQVGYRYGCLSEIQVSMCDEWTAIEILRRGIYLLEFLERRWKLTIGDTKQKISALGLDFVLKIEKISIDQISNRTEVIPAKLIQTAGENEDRTPF